MRKKESIGRTESNYSPSISVKGANKNKEGSIGAVEKVDSRMGREDKIMSNSILEYKSVSTAKQEFTSIFKKALKGFEVIAANVKSKNESTVSIISTEDFMDILNIGFKFHPVIEEDEEGHGYTVALDEIMVQGDGKTTEEALNDLIDNVIEYTELYFEKLDFYKQIPNRRNHYPYLRRIAKCTNKKQILEVITECHKDLQLETLKKSLGD